MRLDWADRERAWAAGGARPVGRLSEVAVDRGPTEHRLIVGDNLPVLRLLAEELGSVVRAVVIDPPYNTGRDFMFADRFGERGGDPHEAWLSMMLPRLRAGRELLCPEGVMFVSIDDREVHRLRLILDDVFGASNHVATIVWQKVFAPKSSARHFSGDHEYVLVYARDAARWTPRLLPRTPEADARYKNPDGDPRGPWASDNLCARNPYEAGVYPITTPSGRVIPGPPPGTYWRVSEARLRELDADGRIWWGKGGDGTPRLKRFLSEVKPGRVPQTLWTHREVGHTQQAKKELLRRLEVTSPDVFDTPKPTRLVRRMLQIATAPDRGDVVLDFFAGSGTTGEAVLHENAADGGDRRFVLVELDAPTGVPAYPTLASIPRARLASAAAELAPAHPDLDVGLRVQRYEPHEPAAC